MAVHFLLCYVLSNRALLSPPARYPVLIGTTAVPELNLIRCSPSGLEIGAAVTLTQMVEAMREAMNTREAHESETLRAVVEQVDRTRMHKLM